MERADVPHVSPRSPRRAADGRPRHPPRDRTRVRPVGSAGPPRDDRDRRTVAAAPYSRLPLPVALAGERTGIGTNRTSVENATAWNSISRARVEVAGNGLSARRAMKTSLAGPPAGEERRKHAKEHSAKHREHKAAKHHHKRRRKHRKAAHHAKPHGTIGVALPVAPASPPAPSPAPAP